jgi:AcrR family transcriptional regulator
MTSEERSSLPEAALATRPGLRERKKAKTRNAIQLHALRLFREQGWEATTVDQIADAAEVSPSTFFRYFPTKEDVVLYDAFDPLIIEAIRAQPPAVSPIGAVRAAMRDAFGNAPADEVAQQTERGALILSVPELRMRMLDEITRTTALFADAIAERAGRPGDDFAVQTLVGAVMGVGLAAWFSGRAERVEDFVESFDRALELLEAGLPL